MFKIYLVDGITTWSLQVLDFSHHNYLVENDSKAIMDPVTCLLNVLAIHFGVDCK